MPLESHAGIGFAHALAVVDHLDQGFTGIVHNKPDLIGPRVYGIFQQFLYSAGRPLDHFAGRDLVGDVIGQ